MTFFSRRRIQAMLDDLSAFFDAEKRLDLTQRLNNKKVEQSLPAEMELAILWMLKDLECLEIEPYWWSEGKRPDAYVDGLLPKQSCVIEIKTVADNSISGEYTMDSVSRKIMDVANSIERGSGKYLFFTFSETRKYERGRYIRGIAAFDDYTPSENTKADIKNWLSSGRSHNEPLNLNDAGVSVIVQRRKTKQTRYHNTHTSRPPRTYSDTKNPIYAALKSALDQIELAPKDTWRVIFLAEAGSRTLANVIESRPNIVLESHSTAENIIERFLEEKR